MSCVNGAWGPSDGTEGLDDSVAPPLRDHKLFFFLKKIYLKKKKRSFPGCLAYMGQLALRAFSKGHHACYVVSLSDPQNKL